MRFGYTIRRKIRDPKIVIGEILEIVYIRKEKRTVGSFERRKSGGGKRKSFHGFSTRGGATFVLAQQLETRWKMKMEKGLVADEIFFRVSIGNIVSKFCFQKRKGREIYFSPLKIHYPRNRTNRNIQNERRNILEEILDRRLSSREQIFTNSIESTVRSFLSRQQQLDTVFPSTQLLLLYRHRYYYYYYYY